MRYRLGLDLGTNSIGWWMVQLDSDGHACGSLGGGVRIFSDGRNPKDGTSLAVQRRVPRGMRRRRDRYLGRRSDLMNHLIAFGLMPGDEAGRKALEALDPYALRAAALDRPLLPHELGRALFHLNQRRGFKSNRKTDSGDDDKETGVVKERIGELRRLIDKSGARTLGEFLHKRHRKGRMVRARPEAGFYPERAMYEDEFRLIREQQQTHQTLTDEQWEALQDIVFFQRPLKPVDPGWCLFEAGEKRAHRALPLTQEFRMVQEANNLRVTSPGEPARRLTMEERDKILGHLRKKKELKLDSMLKLLKLPSGSSVNLFDDHRTTIKGEETAARLSHKDIFGEAWFSFSFEKRTEIVRTLLDIEKPEEIERIALAEWGLSEAAAKKLAGKSLPEGYSRLSEKAIAKLLPIMEDQGLNYAEAVQEVPDYAHHSDFRPDEARDALPYYGEVLARHCVGADPSKPKEDEVAHWGRLANPTVHIGLNQIRRVVNRLIEVYGKPEEIVIELARDLKMNKEEKDKARKANSENEAANRRREEQLRSAGTAPSPHLLRKLRLWEEQKVGTAHLCPFTGDPISFEMAISEATEIEHILPFSKTLDDSMANKVVCLREANRAKRDRAPHDAFHTDPAIGGRKYVYNDILFRADNLPANKRWRFHPDAMDRFENEERDFLDRQLNETKYLSRIARSYLANLYNEKAEGRMRVRAIPGKLTAMLRGKWGLAALLPGHNMAGGEDAPRKNRNDHRHHALDAFVIANTTQGLLKRVAELNADADRKRLVDAVPDPWEGFDREELRTQLARLTVAHKADHGTPGHKGKTTGALHNDTAYGIVGPGKNGNTIVVSRTPLSRFANPKDMDRGLTAIRDKALREALTAAWEAFKAAPPELSNPDDEDSRRKPKNPAMAFAEMAATQGIELGGRRVKVRRARMCEELGVVPIKDRKTGKAYKAYKPDGNAFNEVYELPNGNWVSVVIRRFDANQAGFNSGDFRPHPAARKVMRLHIDDMVAVDDGGQRRVLRVVKLSGQKITLADHFEGGALKTRDADKEDPFKYLEKSANVLKGMGLRKVGVNEIGRLIDHGAPRIEPSGNAG
ncbi:type II CRISPR RNA-guided endonuclease Cas9 [Parvibaculum sp.]|jgi:CRISPR-associated endonuclease Csn1|uniref:type II CRISPR RNA-guided endonuclease Cas9 n=1 Tax=Parvibaculum sp. TaxID=2024848 RepID=UPI002FD9DA84